MSASKTLRLVFPQWQGGNNPPYYFGAELLEWLAPAAHGAVEYVHVRPPDNNALAVEHGIKARTELLAQLHDAQEKIRKHTPDKIVMLGGDCLANLAPIAWLNQRYAGDMGVLWVDTHPDIMDASHYSHAHAMVLRNLLGEGDREFVAAVPLAVKSQHVMYAGLHSMLQHEAALVKQHGIRHAGPEALAHSSQPVLDWLDEIKVRHLAIHLDLDVLDATLFRALLFANPDDSDDAWDGVAQGKMRIPQIVRLLQEVAARVDVVEIGITEHLPWDALALKHMLQQLPLIGQC